MSKWTAGCEQWKWCTNHLACGQLRQLRVQGGRGKGGRGCRTLPSLLGSMALAIDQLLTHLIMKPLRWMAFTILPRCLKASGLTIASVLRAAQRSAA